MANTIHNAGSVTVHLEMGETVDCTFTNGQLA